MADPNLLTKHQNSTTTLQTTVAAFKTTVTSLINPDELTADEKRRQKLFGIMVITCFFTFLFSVIGYVAFVHIKRLRLAKKQRKELLRELENPDKPVINRRTAVMGQGQKQVVIERKASVASGNRKQSTGSQYTNAIPASTGKLLRQPTWIGPPSGPPPPLMNKYDIRQNLNPGMNGGGDVFFPNTQPTNPYAYNPYPIPPMSNYLDNVLVRYRGDDDFKAVEKEGRGREKYTTAATTEETEEESTQSSSESVRKDRGKKLRRDGRFEQHIENEEGEEVHEEDDEEEEENEEEECELINKDQKNGNSFYDDKPAPSYADSVRGTNENTFLLNSP